MNSWAVQMHMSCKSVPRRKKNDKSQGRISGKEICGKTDRCVCESVWILMLYGNAHQKLWAAEMAFHN